MIFSNTIFCPKIHFWILNNISNFEYYKISNHFNIRVEARLLVELEEVLFPMVASMYSYTATAGLTEIWVSGIVTKLVNGYYWPPTFQMGTGLRANRNVEIWCYTFLKYNVNRDFLPWWITVKFKEEEFCLWRHYSKIMFWRKP